MDDSFFGFNTSEPLEDDSLECPIEEPSEDVYDALNDETFGAAVNGDWEETHEHLVRADTTDDSAKGDLIRAKNALANIPLHIRGSTGSSTPEPIGSEMRRKKESSDWQTHFSSLKLNEFDLEFGRQDFNASPWGAPSPRPTNGTETKQQVKRNEFLSAFCKPQPRNTLKINTLEDIERNMLLQQKRQHEQRQQQDLNASAQTSRTATPIGQPNQVNTPHLTPINIAALRPPPGITPIRPAQTPAHAMAPMLSGANLNPVNIGLRFPPGFNMFPPGFGPNQAQLNQSTPLPHPLLNQRPTLPPNYPFVNQRQLPGQNFPAALNNFAMHPNFNPLCAAQPGFGPALQLNRLPFPNPVVNNMLQNQSTNAANLRLVQEIQQNHPLLQSLAWQQQQQMQQQRRLASGSSNDNSNAAPQQHRKANGKKSNGNATQDEYPEYANLMSTRDKHWLINIQLTQLNTDTPYIDDFYYTIYKERKALANGTVLNSQAHKDNQLNHPLSHVREHVQLILVQMGNKNGQRNGQHRDRRSSENTNCNGNSNNANEGKQSYISTQNSLGKLQYCSVTAPRKIIDADIMGSDLVADISDAAKNDGNVKQSTTSVGAISIDTTANASKKTRCTLLHIETLYLYLLSLEDINNPVAIDTIVRKKKKESDRVAAVEHMESISKTPQERALSAANPALKNRFNYELESRETIMQKIHSGLSSDKVAAMMNIRKGKVLIRRLLPHIIDCEVQRNIWCGIFTALQNMLKKDREEADNMLLPLLPEFRKYLNESDWDRLVETADLIHANDKNLIGLLCCKFGISSLVSMMLRAEKLYERDTDQNENKNIQKWCSFLVHVSTSLNQTLQNRLISAAIELDTIQPMLDHIARFKNLQLDALFALVNQAKKQIV